MVGFNDPPELRVCGADFSGALKPDYGSITFVCGDLRGSELVLEAPRPCEDRLDLLAAIQARPGLWGVDFPFALPQALAAELDAADWAEQLELAGSWSREAFKEAVQRHGGGCNGSPEDNGLCFRATDLGVGAQSPIKTVRPDMAAMTYAGLKLLAALRATTSGDRIYPFDGNALLPMGGGSVITEVYPRLFWRWASVAPGGAHTLPVLVELAGSAGLTVRAAEFPDNASGHDRDAAAAGVGLALTARSVARGEALAYSAEEKARMEREGLIVRPADFPTGPANG